MAITRFDSFIFRGSSSNPDTSSYVYLNPSSEPGSLVFAGSCAARASIGSQVACRLSLEHFVSGALESFLSEQEDLASDKEQGLFTLESAFRNANSSVYSFGHKLAAGGRMAASLLGFSISDGFAAAGRVGTGSAYLFRGGELFPYFEAKSEEEQLKPNLEYVGSHSLVSVEIASVPLEANDTIVLISRSLPEESEASLKDLLSDLNSSDVDPSFELASFMFDDAKDLAFLTVIKVGPEAFYLSKEMLLEAA